MSVKPKEEGKKHTRGTTAKRTTRREKQRRKKNDSKKKQKNNKKMKKKKTLAFRFYVSTNHASIFAVDSVHRCPKAVLT